MLFFLLFIFIGLPLLELMVLLKVGELIGFWDTVGVILFTGILGAVTMKSQGRQVFGHLEQRLQSGQFPSDAIFHGVMIFVGGVLMVTPGFITDALGLALMVPAVRVWVMGLAQKLLLKGVRLGAVEFYAVKNNPWPMDPDSQSHEPRKPAKPADVIELNNFRSDDSPES